MSIETSLTSPLPSPMQPVPKQTACNLGDLVDQYLSEMPARVERLSNAFAKCDWEQFSRNVHQLKGSAGSYGFPAISDQAERLEQLFADRTTSPEVTAALADLIALCEQAQSTREATVPAGNALNAVSPVRVIQ